MNPETIPSPSTSPASGRRPLFIFMAVHLGLATGLCILHGAYGDAPPTIGESPARAHGQLPFECIRDLSSATGSGCCHSPSGPNACHEQDKPASPPEAS
jgi:hypothetical protein